MVALSPIKRLYFDYLSRMYAWLFWLSRRAFLGVRLSTLARWLPVVLLLVGWAGRWPAAVMLLLIAAALWINYSLWRARRDNYNRFVPAASAPPDDSLPPLPPNQKVSVQATGLFSVSGRDNNLLLRPGQYWRVPLGEHVIMVEETPGKYLYQFFNARNLQDVRPGWLLFGPHPIETVAVTFLSRWGPEYTRFGQVYEDGGEDNRPPKRVTVYLSIPDEATRRAVWHTILSDARQARLATAG
jgi:hypothetical protein